MIDWFTFAVSRVLPKKTRTTIIVIAEQLAQNLLRNRKADTFLDIGLTVQFSYCQT